MQKTALTFTAINQSLKSPILSQYIGSQYQTIDRVKLFNKNQSQVEEDVLYIGMEKDFEEEIDEDINLILCSREKKAEYCNEISKKVSCHSNVVFLENNNIAEVLSDVQDIIYDYQRRVPNNQELIKTILENDSVHAVITKCQKLFQNPVAIVDSSFKLLEYTKESLVEDSYWLELVRDGYPSINSIIAIQKANAYKDFVQPTIIYTGMPSDTRKIISRIQDGKTILGYIGVLEVNRFFQDSDLELLQLISKILAKILLYRNVENNKCDNDRYEQLIIDILDGKVKSEKQIQERLSYLKWNKAQKYCLLSIDLSEKDNADTLICYFKGAIKKLYPTSNLVIYKQRIIIIDGVNEERLYPEESYLDSLRELLKKSGLNCGLSNCFSNMAHLYDYYKQSQLAVELGTTVGEVGFGIHSYREYARMYMIQVCGKYENLKYFYHPAITQLKEYDDEKGTHYIETLEAFLKYNKNSYAAAEAIYIHRNTMVYRINKIKEIIGLNFDDKDTVDLMISLEILRYEKYMK